ncbi:MAG: zf-HC2 domain-containing protein [Bacillota bacterium]
MQCQEIQESLSAYIDGMLDPSAMDTVDRHLEWCPVCRSEAEALKMNVRLVRELPEVEPPADFGQNLRAKLEQVAVPAGKTGTIGKMARGRWSGIVALAASFLLVVGTAASVWDGFPLSSGVQELSVKSGNYEALGTFSPGDGDNAKIKKAGEDLGGLPVAVAGSGTARESAASYHSEKISAKSDLDAGIKQGTKTKQKETAKQEDFRDEAVSLQAAKIAPDGNGVTGRGAAAAPAASQAQLPKDVILDLKVKDKTDVTREVFSIARRYGGVAAIQPETDDREILLKVPEENFEKVISDVGRAGKITREDYSGQTGTAAAPPYMEETEALGKGGSGPEKAMTTMTVNKEVYATEAGGKEQDLPRLDSGAPMATIRIRLE